MQIRTRLTLQFLLIGGMIMLISSSAIYLTSSRQRKNDFQKLLLNKARTTLNMLSNTTANDAKTMLEIEKKNPSSLTNERIVILNYDNEKIVYTTDIKRELKITASILEKVQNGFILTFTQKPFEGIATIYYNNFGSFIVIAAAVDTEGSRRQEKLLLILTIVCLLSFVLFFVAGWFYSGRALKPISDVIKSVEEISITSLNKRVDEGNGTDEIARLAITFNNMLERLETAFSMQKDFISNASHELRTPLTSINGQLEVLLMNERSKEDYKAALNSVLEDIRSLIDISNRLLLMAKASAQNNMSTFSSIRLDDILWQVREDIMKHNPGYTVNIHLADNLTESEHMITVGEAYMLKVAITNIAENGCKYSNDHQVDARLDSDGSKIILSFTDHGIGISQEDLAKIFEPFYRGSNTISYPGTGIGLALVRQIIKIHGGSIDMSSEINKGTNVTITLPVAP